MQRIRLFDLLQGEDDGQRLVDLSQYVSARASDRPVGVYAVHDSAGVLGYVGYSRNIVAALKVSCDLLYAVCFQSLFSRPSELCTGRGANLRIQASLNLPARRRNLYPVVAGKEAAALHHSKP